MPHVHWPPWSSSLTKQIGHGCSGSSASFPQLAVAAGGGPRGDADGGPDAAAPSGFGGGWQCAQKKEGAIFSNSSPGKGVHNAALAAKGAMSNIAAKIRT